MMTCCHVQLRSDTYPTAMVSTKFSTVYTHLLGCVYICSVPVQQCVHLLGRYYYMVCGLGTELLQSSARNALIFLSLMQQYSSALLQTQTVFLPNPHSEYICVYESIWITNPWARNKESCTRIFGRRLNVIIVISFSALP